MHLRAAPHDIAQHGTALHDAVCKCSSEDDALSVHNILYTVQITLCG